MDQKIKTVAIIGAGPAGATLATLLARKGYKVGLFDRDKRPPLLVGESLLPAVVSMLRVLGVEEEVKSFSVLKPGATVCFSLEDIVSGFFSWSSGSLPNYTYNTPRDQFDQAVLGAAQKAGVAMFRMNAKLEKGEGSKQVRLSQETLDATSGFFENNPDLIVDATGRLRLIAKLLEVPESVGDRQDVCLFAHLDRVAFKNPGNIHLDLLEKGWGWRIPLRGKGSVGVVINPAHLSKYGPDIETQFDSYLAEEKVLKVHTQGAKRITPVMKYNNYQLISEKMYGPGWAMIGDAAGFIDPAFSTGVYLAMKSAFELFKAIELGTPAAMETYENEHRRELKLWQRVVNNWYNGRLFNLFRVGQQMQKTPLVKHMGRRVQGRILRVLSGQIVGAMFNYRIVNSLVSFGAAVRSPKDLVVQ